MHFLKNDLSHFSYDVANQKPEKHMQLYQGLRYPVIVITKPNFQISTMYYTHNIKTKSIRFDILVLDFLLLWACVLPPRSTFIMKIKRNIFFFVRLSFEIEA